jgi:tungstate transport system ATP-binding protein
MSGLGSEHRGDGTTRPESDLRDHEVNDPVLELRDVVVRYDGRTVLDVPRLAIGRGETLTLLGENGSGKTTLLRVLSLLMRPHRGRVLFGREDVDFNDRGGLLRLRRRMAGVMQEPLLCRMTVRQNVGLGLRFRGLAREAIDRRVDAWLGTMSIPHLADRPAAKLSGGEAQRTSLARALVLEPEALFLDEPFAALDAPTRQSLMRELKGVLAEAGVTAIFATHDRSEAVGFGGRVAVLMDGGVAQIGTAAEVFSRPSRADVARFVGIETMIPGRVIGAAGGLTEIDCTGVRLVSERESEVGQPVFVAVRPEEIHLHGEAGSSENRPAAGGAQNVVSGRIVASVPGETHHRVEAVGEVPFVAVVSRARFRDLGLEEGALVRASFSARAAHLIPREPA